MKKFLIAAALAVSATSASALDIMYPQKDCAEILSAEYSTPPADSSYYMYEILCKSADGKYTTFIVSWATAGGFLGFGRISADDRVNLIPYDGSLMVVK